MLETSRRHWQMVKTVLRVYFDNREFRKTEDDAIRTTMGETSITLVWRDIMGLSRADVMKSRLPYTIGCISKLLFGYDDFCDNGDQISAPDIRSIKHDPQLSRDVATLIRTVKSAPIQDSQKDGILQVVNRERYRQYDLQKRYAYGEEPLPSDVALQWREAAAGHFVQMFIRAANRQHNITGSRAEEVVDAAYWFGANLQFFDDIIDIGGDLTNKRQTPFRSLLWENKPEWEKVMGYLGETGTSRIPANEISKLAGESFDRLQRERGRYFERIPATDNYAQVRFFADPTNFSDIALWYERVFAVRSRMNISLLDIASRIATKRWLSKKV